MKRLFLLAIIFISTYLFAQKSIEQNIPVLSNLTLTEAGKGTVDANQLYKGQAVRFSFNVFNPSQSEPIKAGSCQLLIELGDKVQQAGRQVTKMQLNNYFRWTEVTDNKGKTCLTGKLITDLPPDFVANVFIDLNCSETGSSTIKAQWLDEDQKNLGSFNAVDFTIKKK